ncbi:ERIC3 protein, partial [Drymodes brunneopygia]|nr:ERIC3 protein [Drymodes brunneopygia]
YLFPVIKRRAVPEPSPPPHTGERCLPRRGLPPSRRYRPTTAFNEQLLIKVSSNKGYPKSPLCSNAFVTMAYLGKSKHVSLIAFKDEIEVYQQFSGGQNIRVYKGLLLEGDTFQFTSKRYLGYPFSLTFFLNGMQVDRVSCCCEYKHLRLSREEKRDGSQFVLFYRCMVEMGLDKKPSPPRRKIKFLEEDPVCCWEHAMYCEPSDCSLRQKPKKSSVVIIRPRCGTSVETVDETLGTGEECSEEE